MEGIAASPIEVLIKGIPETLLIVLAIHIFMNIKIIPTKFILLSVLGLITTYLIRFLPISLGVNSIILLIAWVVFSQLIYKLDISKIIKLVISVVVTIIFIMIAEMANMVLLNAYFGEAEATALWTSTSALTKSLANLPATIVFAILVFISWLVLAKIRKNKKDKNGKSGEETGA